MAKMYQLAARSADTGGLLYASNDPATAGNAVKKMEKQDSLFSEVLMDQQKNYWFSKQAEGKGKDYTVFIFDHANGVLKSHAVKGRPNFYEFDTCVVVACEGDSSKGSVMVFTKNQPELIKEWKVNGYVWEVEMNNGVFYISSYIAEEDQAVLYIIRNGKKKRMNLGHNMAPTDIVCKDGNILLSCAPILNGDPKKVMVLNDKDKIIREYPLSISPRSLYVVGEQLMVYELDLATGKSERIVYLNLETGEQKEHAIPHSKVVKCTSDSMSLLQQDSKTLYTWDHCNCKIIESKTVTDVQHVI